MPERDDRISAVFEATAARIADDPGRAAVTFRAGGVGGDGVRAEIRVGRHTVVVDEPPGFAGTGAGPSPVESALVALLSCQVVTYRFWAVRLGIPLDDISMGVEGDLDVRGLLGFDDTVRPGFGGVRVVVTLSGPAGAQRYRELAAAVDAHCPVLDMFQNPTPVTTELVVAEDGAHE